MKGTQRALVRIGALTGAALVVMALIAPAAGAQEPAEPQLPTELWKTYPLDPARKEARGEPTLPGVTTTIATRQAAKTTEPAIPDTAPADPDGSIRIALAAARGLAAALGAYAVFYAIRSTFSFTRRRVRPALPLRRRETTLGSARPPRRRAPQNLRSQTGSIVPLTRPAGRKKGAKSHARNRFGPKHEGPPKKSLPGLAPPPAKERQVRSGLPPGKTVPSSAEPPAKPVGPSTAAGPKPSPTDFVRTARGERAEGKPPIPRPATPGTEECEIEWWRGYFNSDFYAFALRPDGKPFVLARSPSFRWRSTSPPPREGPAAKAHAALVDRLRAVGWESVRTDGAWYRTRLRRRLKPTLRDLAG
jgi:hypothetical protein